MTTGPRRKLFTSLLISVLCIPVAYANAKEEKKPSPSAEKKSEAPKAKPEATKEAKPEATKETKPETKPEATKEKVESKSSEKANPAKESTQSAQPSEGRAANPSVNRKLNPARISPSDSNQKADKSLPIRQVVTSACTESAQKKNNDFCSDFIVVFAPGLSRTASSELIRGSSAQIKRSFNNIFNGALVSGPLSKMQALANNPNILVIEDDLEVAMTAIQSSPPWGLDRVDQSNLPLSFTFDDRDQNGANTYSYVVDTGIDATHIDFEGRVAPGFTAVLDGIGSQDCNGHGTHVAGIIAGKTFGVAKKSTLIPVRVLNCSGGGTYSSVISGLDWIAANHRAGTVGIVNMSLGGAASSTVDGAVKNLISKGLHVVVAAGNSNADACNSSPARVPDAITVGSTTISDARSSFSNYGSCLDLFAPGSNITSTWLGTTATQILSGTSMASPHVAGVVARFVGVNATLTPLQVAQSIRSSATKSVISDPGSLSPNALVSLYVVADTTVTAPVDSSPTFRKVNPKGKVVGKG